MAVLLKNITPSTVTLQMFSIASPTVNGVSQKPVLVLAPGAFVDQSEWLVKDEHDTSFNQNIIDEYVRKNILTKITA